jgi:hypothetical protein
MVTSLPVLAAKPADNMAGAQKVAWNLSAKVMPVPPYGSMDITGSDTASKLIVNRPNGKTVATITGAMSGLHANTVYTVYLSNGYTPYVFTGWNVTGNWIKSDEYQGSQYPHDMILTQTGTSLTGSGGYPVGGPYQYPWTITSGSVNGNTIDFYAVYHDCPVAGAIMHVTGTIAPDGTMSGSWSDNAWGQNRTSTWTTTSGTAVKTHTGDSWWPNFFTSTVPAFTFTTDANGAGSWHVNLTAADFPGKGTYQLSIWINEAGATMLISDTFSVTIK